MGYLTRDALEAMGFASLGKDVQISEKASIYGASRISIGDRSRIDDFCVLSAGAGGVEIGRHVHVAVFASLMGAGRIALGDFSGLSSRVAIYSSNDDYLVQRRRPGSFGLREDATSRPTPQKVSKTVVVSPRSAGPGEPPGPAAAATSGKETSRGPAAAATWIVRGDESRRRLRRG